MLLIYFSISVCLRLGMRQKCAEEDLVDGSAVMVEADEKMYKFKEEHRRKQ